MEFSEVLRSRRSVRSFDSQPLDPCSIQRLIEEATLAPSANNSQPWEFWVINDSQQIAHLSERIRVWLVQQFERDRSSSKLRDKLGHPEFKLFYDAPAMVLVAAKSQRSEDAEDCCLLAISLMLAARNADLGTCWIGLARPWFNLPSAKAELGIPAQSNVIAPIIIGHPAEWPEPPRRMAAKIHWLSPTCREGPTNPMS